MKNIRKKKNFELGKIIYEKPIEICFGSPVFVVRDNLFYLLGIHVQAQYAIRFE